MTAQTDLDRAWRALDYSQVPGNAQPTLAQLRLIRDDIAAREPRDQRDADLAARQLAWLDSRIADEPPEIVCALPPHGDDGEPDDDWLADAYAESAADYARWGDR